MISVVFVYSVFGYKFQHGINLSIFIYKHTTSKEEKRGVNSSMQVLWCDIEAC